MSLKEIKARIASVSNTRKTTSAMKMVSSVKLRKAQQAVQYALPYVDQLDGILCRLASMPDFQSVPMLTERPVNRVAIVAISSDSSLCGGFNANLIRHAQSLYDRYCRETGSEPMLYTIGQKVSDYFRKRGTDVELKWSDALVRRDYEDAASLADELMGRYGNNEVDRVIVVCTHFKSAGSQKIVDLQLLPLPVPETDGTSLPTDYILEPSAELLLESLLPRVIRMKMYASELDSFCSEQAARMVAMQAATDNADNLLAELKLQYNKMRQQAITSELLDLAGGQTDNNS